MFDIDVKFKKIHEDAKLPERKHGNREACEYEKKLAEDANFKLSWERPDLVKKGAVLGYRTEPNTNNIIGTGDTGYDVFSVEDKIVPAKGSAVIDTGIEVAYISPGFWFKIESRSGLGFKHGIMTHPGIVDSPYRGNCGVKLYNHSDVDYQIKKGDRIAQLVFYPIIEPNISWSDEIISTERGASGFGSSGK